MKKQLKNSIMIAFFAVTFFVPTIFSPYLLAATVSVTTNEVTSTSDHSAHLSGFVSNPGSRTTVYFQWGESYLTENTISAGQYNNSSTFTATLISLQSGKTYFYRAAGRDTETGEVSYGQTLSFSTAKIQYPSEQIPTIETRTAGNVTGSSAVLNGTVNPMGTGDTVRWFEWGTTQSLGKQTPKANQGTATGNFSYSLSDLTLNTTYYFRAVAQNAHGPALGSIYSFRTGDINYLPTVPSTGVLSIVITQTPSGISKTEVTLNGLALPGGTIATRGWFEWGTTISLGSNTDTQDIGSSASIPFSQKLANLSPGTIYYFRAVIENERGKVFGNTLKLVTDSTGSTVANPPSTTAGGTKAGETKTPPKTTSSTSTTKNTSSNSAMVGIVSGIFPDSLVGWLFIFLLIIIIVIAIDHLVDRYQKRKEEKKRHELSVGSEHEDEKNSPRVIK